MSIGTVFAAICSLTVIFFFEAAAFPPSNKPNIFLAENLDEERQLGYCIDIRGFRTTLNCGATQAHSCKGKTTGDDDTQFTYDAASMAVKAVNYDGSCAAGSGGCLAVLDNLAAGSKLQVTICADSQLQKFVYTRLGEFSVGDGSLCLVVGATSRAAGSYMARDLILAKCSSTDAKLKTWTVIDSSGNKVAAVGGGKNTLSTTASATTITLTTAAPKQTTRAASSTRMTTAATLGVCVLVAVIYH